MKLGKTVYLNKLNGKHYREILDSNLETVVMFTKNNIKLFNDGVRLFRAVDDPMDFRMCTHSEIAKYKPQVFIIENPKASRLWSYIREVLCVKIPYRNDTVYSAYGYPVKKPTSFHSNIDLRLKTQCLGGTVSWNEWSKDYNERSNIPLALIQDIFNKVEEHIYGRKSA